MRLFIDTANTAEIKEADEWGVISGVTTNPSLIAKEGGTFEEVIKEIAEIVKGPVSAEVIAEDSAGMIKEGLALAAIRENIVVKLPMTLEGLKTVKALSTQNIKTNVTLVFSAPQALLAARAGAAYVSPFLGRMDDVGQDGLGLIIEITEIFLRHGIPTQIIAASIRDPIHVVQSARMGAHIATVPFKVLKSMSKHPLTDAGIEKFLKDWAALKNS